MPDIGGEVPPNNAPTGRWRTSIVPNTAGNISRLELIRDIAHPGLLRIRNFQIKENASQIAVTREDVPGMTLAALHNVGQGLTFPQAVFLMMRVGHALAELHARGVDHGDISPHNIIIFSGASSQQRHSGQPVLIDYFARSVHHRGTPGFRAPEFRQGRQGIPSDVFSLAATALWAVTPQDYAALRAALYPALRNDPDDRMSLAELMSLISSMDQQPLPLFDETIHAAARLRAVELIESTAAIHHAVEQTPTHRLGGSSSSVRPGKGNKRGHQKQATKALSVARGKPAARGKPVGRRKPRAKRKSRARHRAEVPRKSHFFPPGWARYRRHVLGGLCVGLAVALAAGFLYPKRDQSSMPHTPSSESSPAESIPPTEAEVIQMAQDLTDLRNSWLKSEFTYRLQHMNHRVDSEGFQGPLPGSASSFLDAEAQKSYALANSPIAKYDRLLLDQWQQVNLEEPVPSIEVVQVEIAEGGGSALVEAHVIASSAAEQPTAIDAPNIVTTKESFRCVVLDLRMPSNQAGNAPARSSVEKTSDDSYRVWDVYDCAQ